MTLPVIDLVLGETLTGGKKELALEMITLLKKELPKDKAEIIAAYQRNDLETLQKNVHRLHGAVSYCGTPQLKEAALQLEIALKKKDYRNIETLYQDFLAAIDRVEGVKI